MHRRRRRPLLFATGAARLVLPLLLMLVLLVAAGGCGNESSDENSNGTNEDESAAALPSFLTDFNNVEANTDRQQSHRDEDGDNNDAEQEPPTDASDDPQDTAPTEGEDEQAPSGDDDDQDDGWSAVVTDFAAPPDGLPEGGAATPRDAATRFLTFLCTGDLNLYTSSVNPAWLEELTEDDLRELREEMILRGFPTGFELHDLMDDPEVVRSDRHAVIAFHLTFPRGQRQRGTLWLENIGDEDQPRWVHSDRPRRRE